MLKTDPMSRDLALFEAFERGETEQSLILLFYTWESPAISLGKIQKNREQIFRLSKLPCFIRPTGGRAVLHGGDLCYTFIAKQNHPDFGGTLKESFLKVNQHILSVLNRVLHDLGFSGLDLAPSKASLVNLNSVNCFAAHAANEITYAARHKIIGAAQYMGATSFIQQGSIQFNRVPAPAGFEDLESHLTLSELINGAKDFDLDLLLALIDRIPNPL
jgi:lipoate-protein ligase A